MEVQTKEKKEAIVHTCGRCKSVMALPSWVSLKEDKGHALFQCPECEKEAEIDISQYPKIDVRVVVNGWDAPTYSQGCD